MAGARSILVRAPNWIGDQVLAFPFFHYLRKANPDARIAVACVPWVAELQYRDLVNDVFVLPPPRDRALWTRLQNLNSSAASLAALSPKGWDLGISLPNSLSSALLLLRAGARQRRGYRADGRGFLLNDAVDWDPAPNRHRSQAYVDLLPADQRPSRPAVDFWGIPPESDLEDPIPGELKAFDPERSWPQAHVLKPPSHPYWVLAPGSQAESRRWPVDRFAELAKKIWGETGLHGLVVGGRGDAEAADFLCQRADGALKDFTGRGSVADLWMVFRNAEFMVSNDSGLAHVATLCGSKVEVVFGAGDPRRTRPLGPGRVQVRANPVECWPCEKNTCFQKGEKAIQCLLGIDADGIWDDIRTGFRPQAGEAERLRH